MHKYCKNDAKYDANMMQIWGNMQLWRKYDTTYDVNYGVAYDENMMHTWWNHEVSVMQRWWFFFRGQANGDQPTVKPNASVQATVQNQANTQKQYIDNGDGQANAQHARGQHYAF